MAVHKKTKKNNKPLYKRWLTWVIGIPVLIIALSFIFGDVPEDEEDDSGNDWDKALEILEEETDGEVDEHGTDKNPLTVKDDEKVYEILLSNAEELWEDDSEMVKQEYEMQKDSYDNLKKLELNNAKQDIIIEAISTWGDDYQMVEKEYDDQLKEYENK